MYWVQLDQYIGPLESKVQWDCTAVRKMKTITKNVLINGLISHKFMHYYGRTPLIKVYGINYNCLIVSYLFFPECGLRVN